MKAILIINEELKELENNKYIKHKKNKTIIKDNNYFKEEFFSKYDYKFYLEEWEIWNEEKLQVCFSNNGYPLRPVHIIDTENQTNGVKALFQTEKMLILRASNGIFEITKNVIDEVGDINSSVLVMGPYKEIKDIGKKLDSNLKLMFDTVLNNITKYNEVGYLAPIYHDSGDRTYERF
jgi:hypothetical protein